MNPIYDQEITLEQAQLLPESIIVYSPITKQVPIDTISVFNLTYIYGNNNAIYLTRSDYAQYIIGNNPVPEGYGYANKELTFDKYIWLRFKEYSKAEWVINNPNGFSYSDAEKFKWWQVCFPLTDLARVEAEAEAPSMPAHFADSTDWKAKYSELEREKNGVVSNYALLKQDYELYKADAEKQIKEARDVIRDNALSFADRFQEATASADSLQDRLTDAQNCIAVQEREITKLKNYIINQLIND